MTVNNREEILRMPAVEAMSEMVETALIAADQKRVLVITGLSNAAAAESREGLDAALKRATAYKIMAALFERVFEPRLSVDQRSFRAALASMSTQPQLSPVDVIEVLGADLRPGDLKRWKGLSPVDMAHCGVLALVDDMAWVEAATVLGQSRRVVVKGGGMLMFVSRPRLVCAFTPPPPSCRLGDGALLFDGARLPPATDPEVKLIGSAVRVGLYMKDRHDRGVSDKEIRSR